MPDLMFEPHVVAVGSCERAGSSDPIQLAFTCTAEAEVVPGDRGETR